jgi:hypothetical protein
MKRRPELHERFAEWLTARSAGNEEDPPRDLALHAAGCALCLRSAAAVDTLDAIDVGAVAPPPLRIDPKPERGTLLGVARFAVAGAALVVVAGSVAIGSSWLTGIRPGEGTADRSPGEGILAGVPSAAVSPSPTSTARTTPSPSRDASPSLSTGDVPSDEPVAPTFANPQPTDQPPSTPPPTAVPTGAPSPTPAPTRTAVPTSTPVPTPVPTPPPTPTPTPVPDTDGDGVPDDVDLCPLEHAGPTPDPLRPGCPLLPSP